MLFISVQPHPGAMHWKFAFADGSACYWSSPLSCLNSNGSHLPTSNDQVTTILSSFTVRTILFNVHTLKLMTRPDIPPGLKANLKEEILMTTNAMSSWVKPCTMHGS
jgi:hypothetical protein